MNFGASRIGFWFVDLFEITWNFTQFGLIGDPPLGGWTQSNRGKRVRFDVQDSLNCGGLNNNRQYGEAIATINTSISNYEMSWAIEGLGEAEAPLYESLKFYLRNITDGTPEILLAEANAPGGGLGCAMAAVTVNNIVIPPVSLDAFKNYRLRVTFDTLDNLFHVGAYYQISLRFKKVI